MGKKIKNNSGAAASSSSSRPPPPQQQQQQQHPANSSNATHRVDADAAQQKEQIMPQIRDIERKRKSARYNEEDDAGNGMISNHKRVPHDSGRNQLDFSLSPSLPWSTEEADEDHAGMLVGFDAGTGILSNQQRARHGLRVHQPDSEMSSLSSLPWPVEELVMPMHRPCRLEFLAETLPDFMSKADLERYGALQDVIDKEQAHRPVQETKEYVVPDLSAEAQKAIDKNLVVPLHEDVYGVDQYGRPTRVVAVYSLDKSTIYKFLLDIRNSVDLNCKGLFLTYVGATKGGVASNAAFPGGLIVPLGKYGPLLESDRKSKDLYELKNYVLDGRPEVYAFTVGEKATLHVLDMTHDSTGLPREDFEQKMLMYVNETGYNTQLQQNVFTEDDDNLNVHYVCRLDHAMTMGKRMELITSYGASYESHRKKAGYGKENLYENYVSTPAALLAQNVETRKRVAALVQKFVKDTSTSSDEEFLQVMTTLFNETIDPIQKAALEFQGQSSGDPPLQFSPRVQWLRQFLLYASTKVRARSPDVAQKLEELYRRIPCHLDVYEKAVLCDNHDSQSSNLTTKLNNEALVETCYILTNVILKPLDESMWCKPARTLMANLAMWAARMLWPVKEKGQDERLVAYQRLETMVYKEAKKAAQQIRVAVNDLNMDDLAFTSGIDVDWLMLSGIISKLLKCTRWTKFFLDNSVTPKCYRAIVAKRLSDCFVTRTKPEPSDFVMKKDGKFVMVETKLYHGEESYNNKQVRDIGSVPLDTKDFQEAENKVNLPWYLVWQVAYVVDCFADGFWSMGGFKPHFSVKLCQEVGIDFHLLAFARARGMTGDDDSEFKCFTVPKTKVSYKKSRIGGGA